MAHCADARVIAVDTESDSFHHYREKVCLIQMTASGVDAIIDPLVLPDLEGLRPLFRDASRIKIFHDAGYDLICLRRDFGFEVAGLFDTMVASRILGEKAFGLAAILKARFGHQANKRLQRSDWTRRPLSEAQIDYARYDTHYLPSLAATLTEELREAGRLAWAEEEFARLPSIAARLAKRKKGPDPDGFWRIRGIRALPPAVLGRIKSLYVARERIAERLDRPPFKVFGDKVLVDLAQHPPRSMKDFNPRPGLRHSGIDRFGRDILKALKTAAPVRDKPPSGVRPRRRTGRFLDPRARARYEALRNLRREKAVEVGVDPEVALGNALLEELARRPRTRRDELLSVPELGGWRGELFGDAVLAVLQATTGPRKSRA
jgi:ribonuclease D